MENQQQLDYANILEELAHQNLLNSLNQNKGIDLFDNY
jgi:hypothetical protein